MKKIRCYRDLRALTSIKDRYEYLKIGGKIGDSTFGFDRYLNQEFYQSYEWKKARRSVILRDNGCDMGLPDYELDSGIIVHHMNPITMDDIIERNPDIFDPEYLICVSDRSHRAIHFGDISLLPKGLIERRSGDTCPWRVS